MVGTKHLQPREGEVGRVVRRRRRRVAQHGARLQSIERREGGGVISTNRSDQSHIKGGRGRRHLQSVELVARRSDELLAVVRLLAQGGAVTVKVGVWSGVERRGAPAKEER